MNIKSVLSLMGEFAKCPQCGNIHIGNGEGTLNFDGDVFKRTCKCGWKMEVYTVISGDSKGAAK